MRVFASGHSHLVAFCPHSSPRTTFVIHQRSKRIERMTSSRRLSIVKNIISTTLLIRAFNSHHQHLRPFFKGYPLVRITRSTRFISSSKCHCTLLVCFQSYFSAPSKRASDQGRNEVSIDEFVQVTWWNDVSKGKFPDLLGLEIVSIGPHRVSCQLRTREELLAPNGYLHAGVVVTLADTACGYGCIYSKPSQAKSFTTIELKSNFLATVKASALITCQARLVHGGKTTQVWDAEVKDAAKDKLMAMFRCTQLLIY